MSDTLGASTSKDNSDGGEALIAYMRTNCNPQVELFAATMLNGWTGSAEKVHDHQCAKLYYHNR